MTAKTPGRRSDSDRETEALTSSSAAPQRSGCVLFVSGGPAGDRGKRLTLERGRARIGSAGNCDLVLEDSSVSREHVELSVERDGIGVRDLGSRNGTYYLGQRIEEANVQPGTRLKLGRCELDLLPLVGTADNLISSENSYGDFLGSSLPTRRLYATLEQLEGTEVPLLIQGETGSGKEVLASAIHQRGLRRAGPYVVIDCGNLQADLLRSELFGHAKGSFTGADEAHTGAFEAANGGTVFLDEIGELSLELQPHLLRVIETGQVKRVGETKSREVDVRVLSATHRDLKEEVAAGRFREDLYYRLAVVTLAIPPLKERLEDIEALATAFAQQLSGGRVESLPASVLAVMRQYDWPGNVRELRNAVYRLISLGRMGIADGEPSFDPAEIAGEKAVSKGEAESEPAVAGPFKAAREEAIGRFEQAYLSQLLQDAGGNISVAAKRAGIDRKYLRDLLKRHGLYEKSG